MSEIKVVKKLTPEQREAVKKVRDIIKDDVADMRRRWNSFEQAIKHKLDHYDELLKN